MKKRGTRKGAKRGSYTKRKPRAYPTLLKTTTRAGKREYQRLYMRDYMRLRNQIPKERFGMRGRRPERILLKDVQRDLRSRLRGRGS